MNKKLIALIIGIIVILGIVIIVFVIIGNKNENNTNNKLNATENNNETSSDSNYLNKIKITFADKVFYVRLIDNESSRDLISMLPLEVDFDDYNNAEKIASLPRKLELNNNPGKYSVQIGDFAYYAPWGNLSIFYKKFSSSSSLQKLGEFENGIDDLKNLKGKAVIEIANEDDERKE